MGPRSGCVPSPPSTKRKRRCAGTKGAVVCSNGSASVNYKYCAVYLFSANTFTGRWTEAELFSWRNLLLLRQARNTAESMIKCNLEDLGFDTRGYSSQTYILTQVHDSSFMRPLIPNFEIINPINHQDFLWATKLHNMNEYLNWMLFFFSFPWTRALKSQCSEMYYQNKSSYKVWAC